MKNTLKLESTLIYWYNWLVETNDSKLIKWYTKVFTSGGTNAKK